MAKTKEESRAKRKRTIRRRVMGTAERPRLTVFRSAREGLKGMKKKDQAKQVGQTVARKCLEKSISRVVFDRNGYKYHGRVKNLADAARAAGLQF
jgi:large subunit ribosomal protein L18